MRGARETNRTREILIKWPKRPIPAELAHCASSEHKLLIRRPWKAHQNDNNEVHRQTLAQNLLDINKPNKSGITLHDPGYIIKFNLTDNLNIKTLN